MAVHKNPQKSFQCTWLSNQSQYTTNTWKRSTDTVPSKPNPQSQNKPHTCMIIQGTHFEDLHFFHDPEQSKTPQWTKQKLNHADQSQGVATNCSINSKRSITKIPTLETSNKFFGFQTKPTTNLLTAYKDNTLTKFLFLKKITIMRWVTRKFSSKLKL